MTEIYYNWLEVMTAPGSNLKTIEGHSSFQQKVPRAVLCEKFHQYWDTEDDQRATESVDLHSTWLLKINKWDDIQFSGMQLFNNKPQCR